MIKLFLTFSYILFVILNGNAQQTTDSKILIAYDSLLNSLFNPGQPGGTVIVIRKGETIFHKAYGMADLELNVPMQKEMVFRIGSITKQFTAIAILKLAEQGKISLKDDIKKYIPDFSTYGRVITIEHLLTHTSGIKSYTSLEIFDSLLRNDLKPFEVIDLFKNEQLEFEPGEKWSYNNSGYFLLGYIIEKISGNTYE